MFVIARTVRPTVLVLALASIMLGLPGSVRADPPPILQVVPLAAAVPVDGKLGLVDAYDAPDLARNAGARWQRVSFFWNELQPGGPREWLNKAPLSEARALAERRAGVAVVGLLGNPPGWATRNGSVPRNLDLPPGDPRNYWARFVRQIVGKYRQSIDHWIIWNEPDIDVGQPGSTWAGTEEEYYQLLKVAFLAAREANPNARIVFAGTTYWIDYGKDRQVFLERILRVAEKDPTAKQHGFYFDVVDLHLYSTPRHLYEIPLLYQETLARYGLSKPIWVTETNVVPWNDPVAPLPRGGYRATLDEQASFVVQAVALARAAGVERIGFFKMTDGLIYNGEPYGIVRNNRTARPAYRAFQTAATHLSGLSGGTYDRKDDVDSVVFQPGSRRITVLWSAGPKEVVATPTTYGVRAQLVSKDGQVRSLPIPIAPGQNRFRIPLPAATANVKDLDPNHYIIGGDPFILIEEGFGDRIQLDSDKVYYPIVGHFVSYAFLRFFDSRGGLDVFGYPRSEEMVENGRVVQYFQRARFEFFPEHAGTPYEVQLGLLADELTRKQQPFPKAAPFESTDERAYFAETGHSLGGLFLQYFNRFGGLDVFGYPISEPVQVDGRTVQYFQRMRLEYFPEHAGTRYVVQLGLVGDEYLEARGASKPVR